MKKCKKTPLYDFHKKNGKIVEFAGFCMPLYYISIIQEHLSVRENVGLFDVSHMGRFLISGEEATDFLDFMTVNDVNKLVPGKAQYTLLLNNDGGIIDDLIIYKITDKEYLLVVNAGNRDKDFNWIDRHIKYYNWGVKISDKSDNSVMFALQGPNAPKVLSNILSNIAELRRFNFTETRYNDERLLVSRTGYTGEDGFELILFSTNNSVIHSLWNKLYNEVKNINGLVCGLGARDSLRIEAGYCLYGNDIDENTDPFEAGLDWVVKMYKNDFIGKNALIERQNRIEKIRMGLVMNNKIIPRSNYKIFLEGEEIGYVTSGTFSPILNKGVGMVYVKKEYAERDMNITVLIRNKYHEGVLKEFPLYNPDEYGYKRKTKS